MSPLLPVSPCSPGSSCVCLWPNQHSAHMAVSLLGPSSLPLLNLSHLGLLHLGILQACETVCLRPKPSCCLPKPVLLLFLTQVNMPSTDTESQSLCSLCCIDFSHSTNNHFYFLIYFKTVPFSLSP